MRRTMRNVGVPVVYTTLALFLGFLVFAGSSFVPIQNFGMLTAVTLAAALGANLLVLPALLATTKIITLWDLVGVKLGQDPQRTIPLLAGLRPAQARIVVLMGEMKQLRPGRRESCGAASRATRCTSSSTARPRCGSAPATSAGASPSCTEARCSARWPWCATTNAVPTSSPPVGSRCWRWTSGSCTASSAATRASPRSVFLNLTRILSDRLQRMNDQFVAVTRV